MKVIKQNNKIIDEQEVGFFPCPDTGKYITLKLSKEEFLSFVGIKLALHKHGWKIPLTGVVRRIMEVGTQNIDIEAIAKNPFQLFMQLELEAS